MYGGNNNNSSLLVDMDIILDGVERKAAWVMSDITVCFSLVSSKVGMERAVFEVLKSVYWLRELFNQ